MKTIQQSASVSDVFRFTITSKVLAPMMSFFQSPIVQSATSTCGSPWRTQLVGRTVAGAHWIECIDPSSSCFRARVSCSSDWSCLRLYSYLQWSRTQQTRGNPFNGLAGHQRLRQSPEHERS
jgi:hypothetical protein